MTIARIGLVLVFALACGISLAARLVDRSPFTQGHWWNPERSGSGFELFNVGSEVMAIWYTYDDAGRPVWYTAQGAQHTTGWALRRHRWVDGRFGPTTVVGTFSLSIQHEDSAQVAFEIDGKSGAWTIEPFRLSGMLNDVDHSGSYYDPANSGWGLTLTHQGDVLGGVLYTYDASGAPTWYAGFERGAVESIAVYSTRGACPTCAYAPTTTSPAGRLGFEFLSESEMVIRSQVAAPMAAGVDVDGARVAQLGRRASIRPADRGLASFENDAHLKEYLDAAMLRLPMLGSGVDFSAAPPSATFATTNLQESGVDESDLVKTDGSMVYIFAGGTYSSRMPAIRAARVAGEGATMSLAGIVALASGPLSPMASSGLYLHGGLLVSVTGTAASGFAPPGLGIWGYSGAWTRGTTNVELFETSPTQLPRPAWHAQVDGHVLASRRIGDRLYVVSRFVPDLPGFSYGTPSARNQSLLAATPLGGLMPSVRIDGSAPAQLVSSRDMYLPPQGSHPTTADMVLVYALDLPRRRIVQSLGILGTAEAVYASATNLYIATSRYRYYSTSGSLLPEPPRYTTDIHQIGLAADAMTVVASGSVEGTLGYEPDKAAFRMSEHQGRLRVVTSNNVMWGDIKNRLTIVEPSSTTAGLLKTVSYLPNPRRPESLGKPGELLYGTRFLGERLYAVTFKKVDPLYVVDLADAADPKIAGALELPGFSGYLHPLPNGLLLGFGKDARPASGPGDGNFAWYQGLQLSLYDVSDAGGPREIQRLMMGKRGSTSPLLSDHHAFSSLAQPGGSLAIAIPGRIHDGAQPVSGSGDSAYFPFLESGLMRFRLSGTTPADAHLTQLPTLVTHVAPMLNSGLDPGAIDGRSVLFRNGTVYTGAGAFWHQDAAGGPVRGPF